MPVEYDKHGDPIYRPSVSQVIAERLLDYVAFGLNRTLMFEKNLEVLST
jgi:hypothetical protein